MSEDEQKVFQERAEKQIDNLTLFLSQLRKAIREDDPMEMEFKKIVVEECAENLIGLIEQRINEKENIE